MFPRGNLFHGEHMWCTLHSDENTCAFTRNGTNPTIALAGFFMARWRPFFDNGIVRKIFAERPGNMVAAVLYQSVV